MIVVLNERAETAAVEKLEKRFLEHGLRVVYNKGEYNLIMGILGDTTGIDIDAVKAIDIVDDVKRIQEPYKRVNRRMHPEDTVIDLAGTRIGGGNFLIIAGPCSVESESQICEIAEKVKKAGAGVLRGGAFKPRTSPYTFQGLREKGISLLLEAKKETGLPIVTEIMDCSQLELFDEVDIIQIGARNMQNYELLKELGTIRKPVLLKRGQSSTIQELLMSAEYIMQGGNSDIILCERGIRTFETVNRNTLDLSVIPVLKKMTHLPVIVDPSHATGKSLLVEPMALSAVTAGADGLMIEVHNSPEEALCDGQQCITPECFDKICSEIYRLRELINSF